MSEASNVGHDESGDGSDSGDLRRWEIPAIDGSPGNGYPTAARLQALQKQAWDEAWQSGHEEGIASGRSEVQRRAERFDRLLTALSAPFDELDGSVEKQLVELAITIVRQLFRREIQIDPSHVVGVVRDAIKVLPIASRNIQVHLHPEDAELVEKALAPTDGERSWSISEDPLVERGGCRVVTETSQIDAQAESRLNEIMTRISGDGRRQ